MTWSDFYLISFLVGFALSFLALPHRCQECDSRFFRLRLETAGN